MKRILSAPPLRFLGQVLELYDRVSVPRSAAALSYFLVLSLFPALLCVNYLLGLFHLDLEQLLSSLDQLLPSGALAILNDYLGYVAASQSAPLFWAGLVTILFSASAGIRTLLLTMDCLYGVEDKHPIRRLLFSLALSLLFLLTIYLSVVVIFTGQWFFGLLQTKLPLSLASLLPLDALSSLWQWMRYLLLFCCVLLLVLIVYWAGTPRWAKGWRWIVPCALLVAMTIVAASVVFSWFIGLSSRYSLVYGSLASLIILLVWLYLCGQILLLGAVVCRIL